MIYLVYATFPVQLPSSGNSFTYAFEIINYCENHSHTCPDGPVPMLVVTPMTRHDSLGLFRKHTHMSRRAGNGVDEE